MKLQYQLQLGDHLACWRSKLSGCKSMLLYSLSSASPSVEDYPGQELGHMLVDTLSLMLLQLSKHQSASCDLAVIVI